jgi:hypothetical protein
VAKDDGMRHALFVAAALLLVTALGGCVAYYPEYAYSYGPSYYDPYTGEYVYQYRPYYSPTYSGRYDTFENTEGGNG